MPAAFTPISDSEIVQIAGELYAEYCKTVGGLSFNGDPLPTWDEMRADKTKRKIVKAWCAVAVNADVIFYELNLG